MPETTTQIEWTRPSSHLTLGIMDLAEFARKEVLSQKREIEKKASLYIVRNFLKDETAEITYTENGKPFLPGKNMTLSISHSHNKIAVLFSSAGEVGIDTEKISDKVLRIKDKFLSEKELSDLTDSGKELYMLYWCAKEAIYKLFGIHGLEFARHMYIHPVSVLHSTGRLHTTISHPSVKKNITLQYQKHDDYLVVFTESSCE